MEVCVVTIFPSNAKYKNRAKLVLTQMITDQKKELIFLQFQNCLNLFVKSPTFPPRMEGIRCSANYVPLTPISFLERSALAYGDRCSVVYGNIRFTWKQTLDRCTRLASALVRLGVSFGDVVAALSPNVPALYELHFGAPMAGAVVCALNTKFDSTLISELLTQSDAKVLFVDYQFFHIAKESLEILSNTHAKLPILVLIAELDQTFINTHEIVSSPSMLEYETLLVSGETGFEIKRPKDEWDPISLNFTSGTTSRPKGVIYSHRGAYLNSLAAILLSDMVAGPIYLWFVPMFHCSGWCFTWAVAAQGGTNICHRSITAEEIFDTISRHKVTHMGGAPTVLNMLINRPANGRTPLPGKVTVMTGGAPLPPHVLHQMGKLGFTVTHCYGSTETYGPATVCMLKPEWNSLPLDQILKFSARQGLRHLAMEEVDIKDSVTMKSVPSDARTIGEVMLRGNTVMKGYLKNFKATQEAFKGGWFRTGDLGVKHPDGYIELKDRSKDIIVSGGKYISTIEIESVLFNHPAVLEAAVVGRLDDHLVEAPCAFVKLKDGVAVSEEDIIKFCSEQLPNYMAPRTVVFADLPKTSTGKTQKYVLREKAKAMGSI